MASLSTSARAQTSTHFEATHTHPGCTRLLTGSRVLRAQDAHMRATMPIYIYSPLFFLLFLLLLLVLLPLQSAEMEIKRQFGDSIALYYCVLSLRYY